MGENEEVLPLYIILKTESGEENTHYSTVTRKIPDEIKAYAEKELNETEENRIKCLEKLKSCTRKEIMLGVDDVLLTAVLRCCKYDIKKAEHKLKKFLNLRRVLIKNIRKIDPKKLEYLVDDGISDCLPYSDKHGRPIYVVQPTLNLDLYDYDDIATYVLACLLSVITYPLPTTKGMVFLVDCNTKSPTMCFSLLKAYRKYLGIEKTVPVRIPRIDFVNEHPAAHYVYALIRPFLPSKIVNRVTFHGSDFKSLHKIYHPDLLPKVFGGTIGSVNTKLFKEERLKTFEKMRNETIT